MKTVAFLTLGFSFLVSLSASAEVVSASANLGRYDVELGYRIPPRFKAATPTIHTDDIHDGFDLRCVSNLEFSGASLEVKLYQAGTRDLVSTQNVPLKLGRTQEVHIDEESDCKQAADFEQGLQSIGVRDSGIDLALPGTTQIFRLRLESGQSLAEGRFTRDGDAYQLQGFRMDPPATASLYWDLYDQANRNFVLAYQKSEAKFVKHATVPHAAGPKAKSTH